MNIDEKAEIPDMAIATWPEKPLILRKTMSARHLRRRRAAAPPPLRTDLGTSRPRQLPRQLPAGDSALGL